MGFRWVLIVIPNVNYTKGQIVLLNVNTFHFLKRHIVHKIKYLILCNA